VTRWRTSWNIVLHNMMIENENRGCIATSTRRRIILHPPISKVLSIAYADVDMAVEVYIEKRIKTGRTSGPTGRKFFGQQSQPGRFFRKSQIHHESPRTSRCSHRCPRSAGWSLSSSSWLWFIANPGSAMVVSVPVSPLWHYHVSPTFFCF